MPKKMLRPLTPMQRKFVQRFLVHGVQSKAAEEAGYAKPYSQAVEIMKHPGVAAAIAAVRAKDEGKAAMTRERALTHLTELVEDVDVAAKDRISAAALLSKLQGWEAPRRHEHSGPDGGAISLTAVPATREQAIDALQAAALRDPALAEELKKLTGGG